MLDLQFSLDKFGNFSNRRQTDKNLGFFAYEDFYDGDV